MIGGESPPSPLPFTTFYGTQETGPQHGTQLVKAGLNGIRVGAVGFHAWRATDSGRSYKFSLEPQQLKLALHTLGTSLHLSSNPHLVFDNGFYTEEERQTALKSGMKLGWCLLQFSESEMVVASETEGEDFTVQIFTELLLKLNAELPPSQIWEEDGAAWRQMEGDNDVISHESRCSTPSTSNVDQLWKDARTATAGSARLI
ncbi:hypothetical protein TREMEDRAFT_64441 [Tremella mesenterica DSM 1558]|uniref:uncharacterized protein n=1 Tax=Tremella mesenterica (strain ATCC 24925 / CBS 8224 / DSM 1558 / NBRC 9311 / NRRL Y-6157 / RJB 2259-6 / UBC 559-6) TaxID=578456 RepID=UPI0003F494F8|nr:uncharacterized protein TREMEDRAFT_64441 [Tremella mesenterica DSM 1558]EIW67198.1 hypothetical protein TREMEDRAFT_64441 [Tremella mesenterica DSM 1558]